MMRTNAKIGAMRPWKPTSLTTIPAIASAVILKTGLMDLLIATSGLVMTPSPTPGPPALLRASPALARPSAVCARRWLSSSDRGIHDDFAPKKKGYATEGGDVHSQIAKDVEEHKVVVYMKGVPDAPMCGFSNAVVQVMKAEGVPFKGFNVLADPDLREGIKSYSAWPTVPQVYVGGEFIGGCDTTVEMYKSGELRTMLKEAGALPTEG